MKNLINKDSLWWKLLVILVSCIVMAAGMNLFTIPNNLAPGGMAGLATALAEIIPLSIGAITLICNIIVLIFALITFGFKSLLLVIFASVAYSASIDLLGYVLPGYTGDILLASVLGGAMIGLGVGLMFTVGVSTAGTDMVTRLIRRRFPQVQSGMLMIAVDAMVVIVAVIVFREIEIALYSFVTIFVMGRVIDAIMHGVDYAKILLIITDNPKDIENVLCNEFNRGVTEIPAKGGFTKTDKTILMTVARRSEVSQTLKVVRSVDERAFVILYNATEVRGKGFKELE